MSWIGRPNSTQISMERKKLIRLIESLLLGLPVPNIFVATNPDGSWEVVDGLQRISTLIDFAI